MSAFERALNSLIKSYPSFANLHIKNETGYFKCYDGPLLNEAFLQMIMAAVQQSTKNLLFFGSEVSVPEVVPSIVTAKKPSMTYRKRSDLIMVNITHENDISFFLFHFFLLLFLLHFFFNYFNFISSFIIFTSFLL